MTGFDPSRLLAPLVAIMFVVVVYSSRFTTGKSKETPEGLVFAIKPLYAWSRMLMLPAYMAFFLWIAWRQNHVIPWPIVVLCLIAMAVALLQMPGTITLTPTAITQTFWLQSSKTIPYNEITIMQSMHAGRTILVLSSKGTRIRHSANHAAAEDFHREIEHRTGKRLIN